MDATLKKHRFRDTGPTARRARWLLLLSFTLVPEGTASAHAPYVGSYKAVIAWSAGFLAFVLCVFLVPRKWPWFARAVVGFLAGLLTLFAGWLIAIISSL